MTIYEHRLTGCRARPLASYLKGLGVLRLVAEQADAKVRGGWSGDTFYIHTALDQEELCGFFLERYAPTPVVAPWNGGSGFYPKDNQAALSAIRQSSSPRLAGYREAIDQAAQLLVDLGITSKVTKEQKPRLLTACRSRLGDDALAWLDAAYLLSDDSVAFPPLLGTGGNDGRLDFTNNFMQRLLDVLSTEAGGAIAGSEGFLAGALFDEPVDGLQPVAIGQFSPANAGGANATRGFSGDSLVNPWDFVLMLEGAMVFAAAAARRLGHTARGTMSYPFTVHQAATGYGSAAASDAASARGEMWMPMWSRPARYGEVSSLFSEGRARVGKGRGRQARHGVDFARAVVTLGVDRGIAEFQRFGFQVRNGLAYFATPLSRAVVGVVPEVRLLDELDRWLEGFRSATKGDRAPASAARAARRLDDAILALCQRAEPSTVLQVLIALGACERAMARSPRWAQDERSPLRPVPPLSPSWLKDDGSPELRLAVALASVRAELTREGSERRYLPLRRQLEPVKGRPPKWDPNAGRDVAWTGGSLVPALNAVMRRRVLLAVQSGCATYPDRGRVHADLGDITDFIEGRIDDARLADLLWGCALVDWSKVAERPVARRTHASQPRPNALYALMKLCFAGWREKEHHGDPRKRVPILPEIQRLAAAGQGAAASRVATRRLRGSGYAPTVDQVHINRREAERTAAALLFPISDSSLKQLQHDVTRSLDDH